MFSVTLLFSYLLFIYVHVTGFHHLFYCFIIKTYILTFLLLPFLPFCLVSLIISSHFIPSMPSLSFIFSSLDGNTPLFSCHHHFLLPFLASLSFPSFRDLALLASFVISPDSLPFLASFSHSALFHSLSLTFVMFDYIVNVIDQIFRGIQFFKNALLVYFVLGQQLIFP